MPAISERIVAAARGINGRAIRTILWAAAVAGVFGAAGLGDPVERVFKTVRDAVRKHDASGSIVVVALDNSSVKRFSGQTSQRKTTAKAIETLLDEGVNRVFVNRVFSDPNPNSDAMLARVIARHPGRVVLAGRVQVDSTTGTAELLAPVDELTRDATVGIVNIWSDGLSYSSTRVPLGMNVAGAHYPSISAIAARSEKSTATFSPDYSIRPSSIPTISMVDVVEGKRDISFVRNRDVMIGATAEALGDIHNVPGHGGIPGVVVHAIAAETLQQGKPIDIGWVPGYALALAAAICFLQAKSAIVRATALFCGVAGITLGPVVLEIFAIESQTVPAMVLLLITVVRDKVIHRIISNPLTGLPTLDRVTHDTSAQNSTLIGMKIANYGDLRANLTPTEESELLREVVRRLQVGGVANLMHCEDGFVWTDPAPPSTELTDNIEALHAVLLRPVPAGARLVDLTVGFGIEAVRDRPLGNRVGSVQVAALEAIGSGLRWKLHDPREMADADFRLSLMSRIDRAIEHGELWVAYQPKLDLRTMRVAGTEALVRWTHPERGMIQPDSFIPAAEQANRIAGITYFVLNTALADLKKLGRIAPTLTMAVNVSARMLAQRNFAETVEDYLRRHDVPAHRLTVEVTETTELDRAGVYVSVLNDLRTLGVKISIDDFGTKNSNLDYLRQIPASEIKIDQRFIRTLHEDENAKIMAGSTIELAHSLGLVVVAEGVEHPETMSTLDLMGCDQLQGYLIAKPLRMPDLERFLSENVLDKVRESKYLIR